jgi:hypothetical protein
MVGSDIFKRQNYPLLVGHTCSLTIQEAEIRRIVVQASWANSLQDSI